MSRETMAFARNHFSSGTDSRAFQMKMTRVRPAISAYSESGMGRVCSGPTDEASGAEHKPKQESPSAKCLKSQSPCRNSSDNTEENKSPMMIYYVARVKRP